MSPLVRPTVHLAAIIAVAAAGAAAIPVDVPLISKAYEPTGKFPAAGPRPASSEPPYAGTIFVEPGIFAADDPTTCGGHSYRGTGTRTVFDRRTDEWGPVAMHLFDVTCGATTVEFDVHNEFAAEEAAQEVAAYAPELGRLPAMLLRGVRQVWIMRGVEAWGGDAGNDDEIPSFLLIHTGMGEVYRESGIVAEVLVHEAVHAVLDDAIYADPAWRAAVDEDGTYISNYARDYPQGEDAAETLLLWLAVEFRADRLASGDYEKIVNTVPHRIDYFNRQGYDVTPLDRGATSVPTSAPPTSAPPTSAPPTSATRAPTKSPTAKATKSPTAKAKGKGKKSKGSKTKQSETQANPFH